MIKKHVYIGVALIVISLVIFFTGSYATTNIGGSVKVSNLTVSKGSFGYRSVSLTNGSFAFIYVTTTNLTNIYILNKTLFDGFNSYVANSLNGGYSYISTKPLNRSYVFHDNNTAVAIISDVARNSSANQTYVVVDNTNGSPSFNSSIKASIVYKTYSYSQSLTYLVVFGVDILLFIAGIGFIIYGIIKKPNEVNKDAAMEKTTEYKKIKGRRGK